MAEVTLLHLLSLPDDEDDQVEEVFRNGVAVPDPHLRQFDPYWACDFDVFTSDLSTDFSSSVMLGTHEILPRGPQPLLIDSLRDYDSDPESVITTADLFDRGNHVNFVMDLFHQRVEKSQLSTMVIDPELSVLDMGFDPNFGILERNDEMGPTPSDLDLRLGFSGEPALRNGGANSRFASENFESDNHFVNRLGLVDVGSDSDSDGNVDVGIDFSAEHDEFASDDLNGDDPNLRLCWENFEIEDHREVNEDFEWEEVDGGVDEREVLSMFLDDDDASVIGRGERVGETGHLEWEVLLNVRTLEPAFEAGHEGFNEFSFGDHDHDVDMQYELLFGQFAETENAIIGRPPAAKNAVQNLHVVHLSEENLEKNSVICAVCKDEMGVGETARQLPCNHRYHGDCILPWLDIRNTCPVCRYELPSDDPDYERRKEQRVGRAH